MARPVFANLGFILQIAGMLMILPIILGFYFSETNPLIAYFTTTITFFIAGFLFNAFSKREDMDFKSSAILLTSVFFVLALIGTIPYLYLDVFPGTPFDKFTDSYLESMSGYTTGGFTFIDNVDELPKSLVFYRSLTQWIGGIGIIFVLLAFFYPSGETLRGIGRMIGLDKLIAGMKLVLSHILLLYTVYLVVLVGIIYLVGFTDLFDDFALIMSSLTTGGLSPATDFTLFTNSPALFVILVAMFLGSLNFFVHDKIIRAKVQSVFKTELIVFVAILLVGMLLFYLLSGLPLKESVFQAVAASTTTGFTVVIINDLNEASKLVLIFLMFVGGMTFSTAGGIKVLRLIMFFKSIPWVLHGFIQNSRRHMVYEGQEVEDSNLHVFMMLPFIVVSIVFLSIFVFVLHGFTISSALFESVSYLSLTSLSTGDVDLASPVTLKWWIVLLFVIGRVEIIAFLVALTSRRPPSAEEK